jgi:glycosyltransferase involved in cell wall biosynthesis
MSPTPVVDVMIPAYGGSELLREAVASVLAQDAPGWRLTVIDDGADDPELEAYLIGLARARDLAPGQVRYRRNPRNLGINRNFQRCLDESGADLVVLLGSDDRLLPDYVRTVAAAAAAHPDVGWIQPGVLIIDGSGRPVLPLADRVKKLLRPPAGAGRVLGGQALTAALLQGNWMYFPSIAFRREVVQRYGFRPGYDVVLDLDLLLRMLFDGYQALLVDHPCFEYRRHAASLSSVEAVSGSRFDEELQFFAEARAQARRLGWPRAARAAAMHSTSRLHALAVAPAAVRTADVALLRRLLRHVLGGTPAVGGRW